MSNTKLKTPIPPRKRASTPRSKTGCVTCKYVAPKLVTINVRFRPLTINRIRRLKCGEEKPCCLRCTKSGWHCDGYEHVNKVFTSRPKELVLAPILPRTPSHSPSPKPSLHNPLFIQDLDEQENRYFQSFIDDVSIHLPAHDAFFWRGIVLQASHTCASVRHGIAAIGALAKSSNRIMSGTHRMEPAQGVHREFALQQYQKAIQGFRHSIHTIHQNGGAKQTIAICLILAFFDNFIGNGGFALQHVRYAREVFGNSKRVLPNRPLSQDAEDDQIVSMLLRLDMQSLCSIGIEEERTYIALEPRLPGFTFPPRFSSLEEARNLRNVVVWEGYNFFYRTAKYYSIPLHQIPVSIIRQRDYFIENLQVLNSLLNFLLQGTTIDFGTHPLRRPEALKLNSIVLLIRLVSGYGAPEIACDELFPHFSFLYEISKESVDFETMVNPSVLGTLTPTIFNFYPITLHFVTTKTSPILTQPIEGEIFTFDLRIIAPLSLIATKCRSSYLRCQAINLLLSSHRREWMYDSLLAGKIGLWMVELEEEAVRASHDPFHEDWCGSSASGSIDDLGEDWFERPQQVFTGLGGLGHGHGHVSGQEMYIEECHRAWGEMVEFDLQNGRRAKVRCRQNFRQDDGSVGWKWRETDIWW